MSCAARVRSRETTRSMGSVLNCDAIADNHQPIVMGWRLFAGGIRIRHAAQDQRELTDTLREDDGFRLGRRQLQGCVARTNVCQDRLYREGIPDTLARGVLVMKGVDHVDSVVWQDKPASRARTLRVDIDRHG